MNKIPLSEFVADKGQSEAGRLLGLTQAGIRKALLSDRTIFVTANDDGSFSAEELKPFPSQKSAEAEQNPAAA